MLRRILASTALAGLVASPTLAAPNPATWNYSRVGNVSTATYQGDTVTNGSATFNGNVQADIHNVDAGFPTIRTQQPSDWSAFKLVPNGQAVNASQVITLNGEMLSTTYNNFLATATPDNVSYSGWALRGGTGASPLVVSNFGSYFENNSQLVWTQEIDVENNGATQVEGSDNGGVGIGIHTGSVYSPDTALQIQRFTGSGTGPGFLRGIDIVGVRNTGVRIMAMDSTTYPGLNPAATGTLTALAVGVSSDANYRFTMYENGRMNWGAGAGATDVSLLRSSAGVLATDGIFNAIGGFSSGAATGVSCPAGTVNLATLTVVKGIITAC